MSLNYTPLRHKMLAEITYRVGGLGLVCTNQKRSIWSPVRRHWLGGFDRVLPEESRAINELWGQLWVDTPHWQGDMDVIRILHPTEAGKSQAGMWSARYGDPI